MESQIIKYGSPVLRQKSVKVIKNDTPELIADILFSNLKREKGIGLACPQVGILKRMFIVDTSPLAENDKTIDIIEEAFINPEIISSGNEKTYYKEGCLSIPGIYEDVLRPEIIKVRYYDLKFNGIEKELSGITARIFQHEYDHLNGVLFIDKLSPLRKALLKGKLKNIKSVV